MSLFTRIKDLIEKTAVDTGYYVEADKSGELSTEKILLTDLPDSEGYCNIFDVSGTTATITFGSKVVCRDDTNVLNIEVASGFTKLTSSNFTLGTGLGGLDTGTIAANTTYYMFAISTTAGLSDILFSLSSTAPTLPAGYTLKRLIGSFKTLSTSSSIWGTTVLNLQKFKIYGESGFNVPDEYITEYRIIYDGSSTIEFEDIVAKDEFNEKVMSSSSGFAKSLSGTWSAGSAGGFLDAAITDDTLYYIYMISKINGSEDFFAKDTLVTIPMLPSGYIYKKLVGYMRVGDYSGSSELRVWTLNELTDLYKIIEKDDDFDFDITGDIKKTIIFSGTSAKTMNLPASSTITNDGMIRGYYISNNSDYELKVWINGGAENFVTGMNYIQLCPHKKIQIGGSSSGWDLITNCDINAMASISSAWASSNFSSLATIPIDTIEVEQNDSVLEINTTTFRITAKITGLHDISFWGYLSSTSGANYSVTFELYKNGVATGIIGYAASGDKEATTITQVNYPVKLTANDYLEVKALHDGNLTGSLETFHFVVKTNI